MTEMAGRAEGDYISCFLVQFGFENLTLCLLTAPLFGPFKTRATRLVSTRLRLLPSHLVVQGRRQSRDKEDRVVNPPGGLNLPLLRTLARAGELSDAASR